LTISQHEEQQFKKIS